MPQSIAPKSVKVSLPADIEKAGAGLVLHIEGLKLPQNSSGIVRVFADLPRSDAATSVEDEHFLGYFTILARNSTEAARGVERKTVTMDLKHKKGLFSRKKDTTLTLVPLGGTSKPSSDAPRNTVTFDRIYIGKN